MSREFDGSTDLIQVDSAPVTAYPLTMSAWYYPDTASGNFMWIGDRSVQNHGWWIRHQSGGEFRLVAHAGGGFLSATTSNTSSTGTWAHGCGIATSATNRRAVLNGDWANSGTNTSSGTPSGVDRITFGAKGTVSPIIDHDGRVAEAAVWDVALTQAEVESLAEGFSPLLIRPQSLVFYLPMVRDDDEDLVGGLSLSATSSPTVADHPRIYYPDGSRYQPRAVAAAANTRRYSLTLTGVG